MGGLDSRKKSSLKKTRGFCCAANTCVTDRTNKIIRQDLLRVIVSIFLSQALAFDSIRESTQRAERTTGDAEFAASRTHFDIA
jgi:hypothetical protein